MSDVTNTTNTFEPPKLRFVAMATLVVIATVAGAALAYLLIDVLLLLFIGIVVASALQPWHVFLCRWGVPRGAAVLLLYFLMMAGLVVVAVWVGPVLLEQIGNFASEIPRNYTSVRSWLQGHDATPLQLLGNRLPPLDRLATTLPSISPQIYQGTLNITANIVTLPVYVVSVLAIAFYWTMEVPRIERLLLSLVAVERRPAALNVWHEIESKLGGFMRGQGIAMFFIGTASGLAYAVIGLPSALVLGILAGLLEAVPFIGPIVAVLPAILIALPMGTETAAMVIGFAVLLHLFESDVLIPRIMLRTVGVSALVSLMALLAFSTLYGVLGVLIAIPMAAVIQVLLDSMLVNAESVTEPVAALDSSPADLRLRIHALRQHARERLRSRTTRMGIDPSTADHVVDAVDQQVELALTHIERLLESAEEEAMPLEPEAQAAFVEKLQGVTQQIEQAVERVDAETTPIEDTAVIDLDSALQRFHDTVQEVENRILSTQRARPGAIA